MRTTLRSPEITRRGMLAGIGGMTFFFAFGTDGTRILPPADAATRPAPLSPWVRIAPDGNITILTVTEMGQGSGTSIPLMIAEEMDADWNKVTLEWAPSNPEVYGWPDRSGRRCHDRHRQPCRDDVLERPAHRGRAGTQGADRECRRALGRRCSNAQDRAERGRRPQLGKAPELWRDRGFRKGAGAAAGVDKSELKARKDFRLIGRSVPRRDLPFKVNGTAQYSIDVKLPGMVYASALHAPVSGNAPEKWNDAAIKAMPGVIATVKLPHGVGIVAESFPQAMAARRALRVTWSKNKVDGFDSEKALEHYAAIHADTAAPVKIVDTKGDTKAAFDGAAKVYKAEYRSDYTYHAQLEPLNAVARFNDAGDRIEVWDGSQDLGRSRDLVARTLGMKPEQVDVHQCYLGGGFGRRSLADYAAEAAVLAREVKRPVKLVWTREEDVAHGMFRPMTFQCLEAATDASGKVVGWRHCAIGDDGGLSLITGGMRISSYYGLPNQQLELRNVDEGVRIKHWRAVAHNFNLFAIETMVDALAEDQKLDPVEFRLQRMSITPKARRCVEAVTKMADWGTKRPDDRALGFAMSERSGSLGACVVEASIDRRSGTIRVHKVWVAADGGVIVQPEAAKANVESGIVYGLSSALHERLTVRDGAVEQSNFGDYNVMRMSDMPEVMQVSFLDSDGNPTGLGEISTPGMAPAIANAFHKLTGKRLYHMPFTPERVLAALKA